MSADVHLRLATVDDAEAYVRCHVECLAETYVSIMPPAFAEQQRRSIPDRIADTRRAWASDQTGEDEATRVWIAVEDGGAVIGVARSGPGPQPWERSMGAPESSVAFELHHIYTRQHAHGTGLGQSLLELAVGDRDAYLWILHGNARAERFYRRNGFLPDGVEMSCGPTWFERRMHRMVRTNTRDAHRRDSRA